MILCDAAAGDGLVIREGLGLGLGRERGVVSESESSSSAKLRSLRWDFLGFDVVVVAVESGESASASVVRRR